jgi:hypothetical protein
MKVYGLSQSSGVERRLFVERGSDGIVLIVTDHQGNVERGRIMIQADDMLGAITDPPPGGAVVEGVSPNHGTKMQLEIEVRRNEVWLALRGEGGAAADVAVGLDDLQDALEGVINPG